MKDKCQSRQTTIRTPASRLPICLANRALGTCSRLALTLQPQGSRLSQVVTPRTPCSQRERRRTTRLVYSCQALGSPTVRTFKRACCVVSRASPDRRCCVVASQWLQFARAPKYSKALWERTRVAQLPPIAV